MIDLSHVETPEPCKYAELKVLIERIADGERRWIRTEWPENDFDGLHYGWTEGSFACDCNLGMHFAKAGNEPDPDCDCGGELYRTICAIIQDRVIYIERPTPKTPAPAFDMKKAAGRVFSMTHAHGKEKIVVMADGSWHRTVVTGKETGLPDDLVARMIADWCAKPDEEDPAIASAWQSQKALDS